MQKFNSERKQSSSGLKVNGTDGFGTTRSHHRNSFVLELQLCQHNWYTEEFYLFIGLVKTSKPNIKSWTDQYNLKLDRNR